MTNVGAGMCPGRIDSFAVPAAELLGWDGIVLPPIRLLGSPVSAVVRMDSAVHRHRVEDGIGPQSDLDVLTMWEWPQAAGNFPGSALSLVGMLVSATSWRRGLEQASRWRGFGPAAVLLPANTGKVAEKSGGVGELCRLEFQLRGVGLVIVRGNGARLQMAAASGRFLTARRRALDRWVEEMLYGHVLSAGLLVS